MKSAIVTGAAGFIGSHLTDALISRGVHVYGIDNFSTGRESNISHHGEKFTLFRGDLDSSMTPTSLFNDVDAIFHLAAIGSVPRSIADPISSHHANVSSFIWLLDRVRQSQKKPRVIFASSSSVYGDHPTYERSERSMGSPVSPYAATKVACEGYASAFASAYGLSVIGLRYFNVFGTRQNPASEYSAVIPKFIDAMRKGQPVKIYGSGHRHRDFTHVSTVVDATIRAAMVRTDAGRAEFINVGMGHLISINQLFSECAAVTNYKLNPEYHPERKADVLCSFANTTKLKSFLGVSTQFSVDRFRKQLQEILNHQNEFEK